jgi:16S rRNA (guanine966-N2)-methyltransferase
MRIIAGQRRGHKIDGPKDTSNTRPTSDMVREAVFNVLGELVEDRTFLDLFAGTGAIGLEALSRGAAATIFVDMDRENIGLIHRNAAILRYEDRIRVRHADVYRWVKTFQPADDRPIIVFLDPPYRDYESKPKELNQLVATLVGKLPGGSAIMLEAGRGLRELELPEADWDMRKYGNKRLAIRILPEAGAEPIEAAPQAEAEAGAGEIKQPAEEVPKAQVRPGNPAFQGVKKLKSPSRSTLRQQLKGNFDRTPPPAEDDDDEDEEEEE